MRWINLLPVLVAITVYVLGDCVFAQPGDSYRDFTLIERHFLDYPEKSLSIITPRDTTSGQTERREYPSPKSVMFKSLMVPGWGQIQNRQIWKVPIIYGMFAGIGYYTYFLHGQYQDYRAAYYNSFPENTDQRFGPTPERLQGVNSNQLQSTRNSLRNRRDFMFVVFVLAYGLNAVDAYVFAHMRSFDVSDDLSARTIVAPAILADGSPGVRLSISLSKK